MLVKARVGVKAMTKMRVGVKVMMMMRVGVMMMMIVGVAVMMMMMMTTVEVRVMIVTDWAKKGVQCYSSSELSESDPARKADNLGASPPLPSRFWRCVGSIQ